MKTLSYLNFALGMAFAICCLYQAVYAAVRLMGKKRSIPAPARLCRYAVLIAARNEQSVIGQLLDSIRAQDYPAGLVDIFVVADNCTDNTALVAQEHGAIVYRRNNRSLVGKGYAIAFLLEKLEEEHADAGYEGYFVFDADNLLDPAYIWEMNKVFASGRRVVTGYRNSKNYGDNWITAGYGMYFLRESEYMNRARDLLDVGCFVSGTGFLFADSLLKECGGWRWFTLTEDLEFTAELLVRGEKAAYCPDAVLYDEQPSDFKQSVLQRSRWIKGYFQVLGRRGFDLVRNLGILGSFGCYDMLMNTLPALVLTVLSFMVNSAMFLVGIVADRQELLLFWGSVAYSVFSSYLLLYALGLLTLITEGKRILCSPRKKVLYSFTFPIFIYSFGLAMFLAIFGKNEWKPIRHSVAVTLSEMKKQGKRGTSEE